MAVRFDISRELMREVLEYCDTHRPDEACGVLLGSGYTVHSVMPITNVADDKQRGFIFEEQGWLNALMQAEKDEHEIIGTFHSHPQSQPIVSTDDAQMIREQMPHVVHVIVGFHKEQPEIGAYLHDDGEIIALELVWNGQANLQGILEDVLPTTSRQLILGLTLIVGIALIAVAVMLLPPAPPLT